MYEKMTEQEKEKIRRSMDGFDELADQYGGHYVEPTLPEDITNEDKRLISEAIKRSKEKHQMLSRR